MPSLIKLSKDGGKANLQDDRLQAAKKRCLSISFLSSDILLCRKSCLESGQSMLYSEDRNLKTVAQFQLRVDVGHVILDVPFGDGQHVGAFPAVQTTPEQPQYITSLGPTDCRFARNPERDRGFR